MEVFRTSIVKAGLCDTGTGQTCCYTAALFFETLSIDYFPRPLFALHLAYSVDGQTAWCIFVGVLGPDWTWIVGER